MLHTTFRPLKKEEMATPINGTYEAEFLVYDHPKKPKMISPEISLPTDIFKIQKIYRSIGEEIDFNFFLDIVSKDKYSEYNGYFYRQ